MTCQDIFWEKKLKNLWKPISFPNKLLCFDKNQNWFRIMSTYIKRIKKRAYFFPLLISQEYLSFQSSYSRGTSFTQRKWKRWYKVLRMEILNRYLMQLSINNGNGVLCHTWSNKVRHFECFVSHPKQIGTVTTMGTEKINFLEGVSLSKMKNFF